LKKVKDIMSAVNHRPFLQESDAHQKFIQAQLLNIKKMESEYPFIDLSAEEKYFDPHCNDRPQRLSNLP